VNAEPAVLEQSLHDDASLGDEESRALERRGIADETVVGGKRQ
jgi:hypothetical protein